MSGRFMPTMLGVNVVLAGVLAAMWLGPQSTLRHTQWHAPAPQPPKLDDALQALLQPNPALKMPFPEVTQRPVFSPDRRLAPPPSADAKAPPPPPIALDAVVLTGIVSGRAFTSVLAQVDGESRVLKRGDQVGDWVLKGFSGRDVQFTKAGESRTLTLPNTLITGLAASPGDSPTKAASPLATPESKSPASTAPTSAHGRQHPPAPQPRQAAMPSTPEPSRQPAVPANRGVSFGGRLAR
jgi:hypothetical protein